MTMKPDMENQAPQAPIESRPRGNENFPAEAWDDDGELDDDEEDAVEGFLITSIGFTGTRRGMVPGQKSWVEYILLEVRPLEVHHGDAVGADAEFHQMVRELLPDTRIVIHPPCNPKHRAFCGGDERKPERPCLARNKDIVRASHLLLAMPGEAEEQLRSSTWSTTRFSRKTGVRTLVVTPY